MRYAAFFLIALGGCSSSNFEVAPMSDTGAADSGSVESDTGVAADTGSVAETSPPSCSELLANPPTVYVDKRSALSKGTSDCPFATIKEAAQFIAALPAGSGKHTIRVAGGAAGSPLVYNEPMIVLKPNTNLTGDGPGRTVIIGGSACSESICMVVMEGNTLVEGVTIDAKLGDKLPLAMGPAAFMNTALRNAVITGVKSVKNPGIFLDGLGTAEIGPDVEITDNSAHGILAKQIFWLKITGSNATPVRVNRNAIGIQLLAGRLDISGFTEVQKNITHGIILSMTDKSQHTIDGLSSTDNGGYGLWVDGGAGLRLRRSKLVGNDVGLLFRFVAGNDLDLGTESAPGDNFFGGKSELNKRAGVCLPASRALNAPARSNSWSMCDPSNAVISEVEMACEKLPAYKDIYFARALMSTTTPPLDLAGCTVK